MQNDWLSVSEVATALGTTTSAIYKLIARGTLGSRRVGNAHVVLRGSVIAMVRDPDFRKKTRRSKPADVCLKDLGYKVPIQGDLDV